jgi:hypothetical protein
VSFTAYGLEALDALRAMVAEAKKDDAMAPVTVIVPTTSPVSSPAATWHVA